MPPAHPSSWLFPRPEGLYCAPGDFFIDPARPVERAVITHGHGDHARPNNAAVLATPETLGIMRVRFGEAAGRTFEPLPYGEERLVGGVALSLHPAGHILGSAQVELRLAGNAAPSSPATTSGRPIRRLRPSSCGAAISSSPRRPSAFRCSATRAPPARPAGSSPRSPPIPTARIFSASTGSANASA